MERPWTNYMGFLNNDKEMCTHFKYYSEVIYSLAISERPGRGLYFFVLLQD